MNKENKESKFKKWIKDHTVELIVYGGAGCLLIAGGYCGFTVGKQVGANEAIKGCGKLFNEFTNIAVQKEPTLNNQLTFKLTRKSGVEEIFVVADATSFCNLINSKVHPGD